MKRLLTILGGLSLATTAVSPVMAMAPATQQKATQLDIVGNQWLNVGVKDYVQPKKIGTHHKVSSGYKQTSTNVSWDTFANAETVQAKGDFDYHTHWNSKDHKYEVLVLDAKNSTDSEKVWTFENTNYDGNEAVNQTSEINMKLTATYTASSKTIAFYFNYTIYAHTHDAVHKMHTSIEVDSLTFIAA